MPEITINFGGEDITTPAEPIDPSTIKVADLKNNKVDASSVGGKQGAAFENTLFEAIKERILNADLGELFTGLSGEITGKMDKDKEEKKTKVESEYSIRNPGSADAASSEDVADIEAQLSDIPEYSGFKAFADAMSKSGWAQLASLSPAVGLANFLGRQAGMEKDLINVTPTNNIGIDYGTLGIDADPGDQFGYDPGIDAGPMGSLDAFGGDGPDIGGYDTSGPDGDDSDGDGDYGDYDDGDFGDF